ncbi:hypothetical protein DO71_5483 [Burkholderia pseudomallei]|nr:hypothetical protein DO71_5483 [Burkholderia pseudomallei]
MRGEHQISVCRVCAMLHCTIVVRIRRRSCAQKPRKCALRPWRGAASRVSRRSGACMAWKLLYPTRSNRLYAAKNAALSSSLNEAVPVPPDLFNQEKRL